MFQCSKHQMKAFLTFCDDKLQIISNDPKYNGFIVFIFHLLFQIISIFFLFFYPISITFYIVLSIWIIVLASNFYFRGCILTKLERYLWNTTSWFGPYYIFCNLDKWSNNKIKNMYICQIITLITILFVRILFKY